jgi:DUF4097 and DUF4098 domain-containing protein YvlB
MSWLYSIFLAGLAFTSTGSPVNLDAVHTAAQPGAYVSTADETEHFDQTYPLTGNGRVNLSNVNGGVTVEAWDRNEVRVEYTKTADSKERLNDVNVHIDSRADAITIETDYDNWKRNNNNNGDHGWKFSGKLEVTFKLTVPRGAMLNEIQTVNGSVDVADFNNYTKVSAVNGNVNARNIRGTARLSTVNGEVHADFDRLETGSRISLDTVNGHVNLVIPSDSNATVKADSLNGNISNDFGLPVRKGKYVGRDLYGRIGNGDVQIKLSSVNGQLAIGRKNDGRQVSPATDLLPAKGKDDDEDWDGDSDVNVDVNPKVKIDKDKINKQIRESMRTSQAEVAKAATQVSTEMTRIRPQIEKAIADSVATSANVAVNAADIQRSIQDAMRSVNAVYLPGVPRVETKSDTFQVRGVPTVTVEGAECSVRVTGWDRSEVQYRIVQFSGSRSTTPLQVTQNHTDTSVNIKVEDPDLARRASSYFDMHERTRIEVMVPKRSNLHIKAGGEVRLDGISGELDVNGGGSSVNVRDSDGKLKIATNDGRIRVIGFRGDVEAISGDAPINMEGEFASLTVKAGDSAVNVIMPANASADLESNCDSVVGEGISVTKVGSKNARSTYRIGPGGGRRFLIESDSRITIRSAETLAQID